MTKSERLLALLQLLRQYKHPVKAKTLAQALSISTRTLYRDIDSLRQQGADIEGEAGLGYVLHDGFLLPPLMFNIEEVEALILGSHWIANHGDKNLCNAASQAMAKIQAVIPKQHKGRVGYNTLFAPLMSKRCDSEKMDEHAKLVRQAMRDELKTKIDYEDANGETSQRIIYPFALAFFDSVQILGGWCELREDFRNFRVDRIMSIELLKYHYYPRRETLFNKWKAQSGINPTSIFKDENTADKN